MKKTYLYQPLATPLAYESCGEFILTGPFRHEERIAESYEFILGISGTLHLQVDQEKLTIESGDFVLIVPGTYYKGYQQEKDNLSFYWCHFRSHEKPTFGDRDSLFALFQNNYRRKPFLLLPQYSPLTDPAPIKIAMNRLLDAAVSPDWDRFYLDYLVTTLLYDVSDITIRQDFLEHITRKNRNLALIAQWIKIHCHERISLERLATEFGYNKTYLSRTFKKEKGVTITEYINNARLEKAKNLLLSTTLTVDEISKICGFLDKSYFMRLFKAKEKLTPTGFRHAYPEVRYNNE